MTRPALTKEQILEAFAKHNGDREKMCAELGVSAFDFYNAVRLLDLRKTLDDLRKAKGKGGP